MDLLIGLFILYWLFSRFFRLIKKAGVQGQGGAGQQRAATSRPDPRQATEHQAERMANLERQRAAKRREREAQEAQERREREDAERKARWAASPLAEGGSMYDAEAARLHMHDADEGYEGSLGGDSMEGKDLCDPSLAHDRPRRSQDLESVYAGEIGAAPVPAMTPQMVMQGVVMSEILKRPNERKWGRL